MGNRVRIDWTTPEKEFLAASILHSVSNGETISKGIDNALESLPGRTKDAAGFQWSEKLRHQYSDEYRSAKAQGSKIKISYSKEAAKVPSNISVYSHKGKQSNWTPEEDEKLARVIIEGVKAGKPTNEGFREASEILQGKTIANCHNRWNNTVRSKYKKEYNAAQLAANRIVHFTKSSGSTELFSTKRVESKNTPFKNALNEIEEIVLNLIKENKVLSSKNRRLEVENHQLNQKLENVTQQQEVAQNQVMDCMKKYSTLKDDHDTLLKVIERARKITIDEDLGETPKEKFKMDKNGNLERVNR